MATETAILEPPVTGDDTESLGALLGSIMPADPSVGEPPPPDPAPAPAEPPTADPAALAEPPPEPATPGSRAFAEMRVQKKAAEAEKARIAAEKETLAAEKTRLTEELEAIRARAAELEASVSERDAKLKESDTYYREKVVIPQIDVLKAPEVAAAHARLTESQARLLTAETADLGSGERSLPCRMDRLPEATRVNIQKQIDAWQMADVKEGYTTSQRRDFQHVALSNIARLMGADASHFEETEINGRQLHVISPSHPLYRHLAANISDAVTAVDQFRSSYSNAQANIFETGKKIIGGRVGRSKELYAGSLALSGDALKQKLAAAPDDPFLASLSVIDSDPELRTALNEAIEHEARVNGHTSHRIEPVEADPQKRTAFATAIQARLDARTRAAPLMSVLPAAVAKQQKQIAAMQAELTALKAEKARFEAAGEPGGGALPGAPDAGLTEESEWERIARKSGMLAGV